MTQPQLTAEDIAFLRQLYTIVGLGSHNARERYLYALALAALIERIDPSGVKLLKTETAEAHKRASDG